MTISEIVSAFDLVPNTPVSIELKKSIEYVKTIKPVLFPMANIYSCILLDILVFCAIIQ